MKKREIVLAASGWFMLAILHLVPACGEGGENGESGDGGSDAVSVVGSVQGTSLGDAPPALIVHRQANTPLSSAGERLDFYLGEGFTSLCPEIYEPVEGVTALTFSLKSPSITTGVYPYCEDFECEGNSLEARFDGWLLPSGSTVRPTAGSAELTNFSEGAIRGSFTLDFEGETIEGEFDLPLTCTDERAG